MVGAGRNEAEVWKEVVSSCSQVGFFVLSQLYPAVP